MTKKLYTSTDTRLSYTRRLATKFKAHSTECSFQLAILNFSFGYFRVSLPSTPKKQVSSVRPCFFSYVNRISILVIALLSRRLCARQIRQRDHTIAIPINSHSLHLLLPDTEQRNSRQAPRFDVRCPLCCLCHSIALICAFTFPFHNGRNWLSSVISSCIGVSRSSNEVTKKYLKIWQY